MAYKGKSRHIRDALVTLLQGVTYDAGGGPEPALGIVTADPSAEFSAEPFCLVLPGPIDNIMVTTSQNDRTVHFSVLLMLTMETVNRTRAATYNYMEDLTDLLMDTLDEADFHDQLNTVDNTIGTWLMATNRGEFVPGESKSGAVLLCTLDVTVSYSKDL